MATTVWTKFSRNLNGTELKFRIQEVKSDKYKDVWNLFLKYYVPEEPIHRVAGLTNNDKIMNEYEELYISEGVFDHCQIDACYLEDGSGVTKLVAGSMMYLSQIGSPTWNSEEIIKKSKTEEVSTFLKLVGYMYDVYGGEIRETFQITSFYDDIGVTVHPDYRGLGIAGELFKARMVTCKERGVPMTGAWMTSLASQNAAGKLGWETVSEITYKDLGKIGGVTFEGVPPSAKYMITKV